MVFNLDALVCETGGIGSNALGGAGEVEQGIDGVDGLVHQSSSSVEGPGATPAGGIIVGLVTIPLDVGGGTGEGAEATSIRCFFEGIHAGVKAAVEHGGQGLAIGA